MVLEGASSGDFIVLLGDFNTYMGNDSETSEGVTGRNSVPDLNLSGVPLLNFCAKSVFSIMNTMFELRGVHKCTWHQDTLGHRLMIDFGVMSSDL